LSRTTAVACFVDGDDLILAAMNLGRLDDPAWALNLGANPEASIVLRGRTIPVSARRATGTEADRLWKAWVALQPSASRFARLAARDVPLFALTQRAAPRHPTSLGRA
jgi:deazaflavin-dependent oxidoreductase (nitroreductase family)